MEHIKAVSALRSRAEEIRRSQAEEQRKLLDEKLKSQKAIEDTLLEGFKMDFKELLPMLDEEDIAYSAHMGESMYEDSYILFKKGKSELKMDYIRPGAYRYEHPYGQAASRYGMSVYGNWLKACNPNEGGPDGFILWITDNLIEKHAADPTSQQLCSQICGNYEGYFLDRNIAIENGYPPTLTIHALIWSVLVGEVYKNKIVCLAPHLSGQFGSSVSIVVVHANEAGHEPVNVLFHPKYSMDDAWSLLDEINEQLWPVSSRELSRAIVDSSMNAPSPSGSQEDWDEGEMERKLQNEELGHIESRQDRNDPDYDEGHWSANA